jgi:hypothetical protein
MRGLTAQVALMRAGTGDDIGTGRDMVALRFQACGGICGMPIVLRGNWCMGRSLTACLCVIGVMPRVVATQSISSLEPTWITGTI